jgi:CMP-N,N'-diacetyllegionaminic acid synthase
MQIKTRVALIPARAGSCRIPGKNIRDLAGQPLIAYSISAARESLVFDEIYCITDSIEYARIAEKHGARVPALRPQSTAQSTSPDISWVQWILGYLAEGGQTFDVFNILRPTSPFRLSTTIQLANKTFERFQPADSLRAVRKCKEHPGKMWQLSGEKIVPLLSCEFNGVPWHSSQSSVLPEILVQDASLEVAWTSTVKEHGSISGSAVIPFFSQGFEGFDINTEEDWNQAELLALNNPDLLPKIV